MIIKLIDRKEGARGALRYARNPMGRGFVLRASREAVDGRALPNIEDPADLLRHFDEIGGRL